MPSPRLARGASGEDVYFKAPNRKILIYFGFFQEGLCLYSEQAGESIHHWFKVRAWDHYKVPEGSKR